LKEVHFLHRFDFCKQNDRYSTYSESALQWFGIFNVDDYPMIDVNNKKQNNNNDGKKADKYSGTIAQLYPKPDMHMCALDFLY
jgi:hypothetical protein